MTGGHDEEAYARLWQELSAQGETGGDRSLLERPEGDLPALERHEQVNIGTSERLVYEYALLRVIPDLERGECVNVGLVFYCQLRDYLRFRHFVDEQRLKALSPALDLPQLQRALHGVSAHCQGDDHAAGDSLGRRFRWLTAPRSTILQPGPVHPGLTTDPATTFEHLFTRLVG
ncbi:hypothetical protein GCM10027589_32680 [Actinocorallia lasiicapitis]